ncbi:glucosyltransferase domain-containing protein [Bosea sp. Root381]|uniref:glucosyltransferase domain-containing protein n=1 Tax=Bosea sp. Root381 TaxID=1736524 RepID=UPI0009E671F3|nr:glucosyltransferase domain-containing protein [Bosea sp. Root381]
MQGGNSIRVISPLAAASFFLIFLVIYLPNLASLSVTIDDQGAIFRTWPWIWLAQGRWAAFLVERYILPTPVIPFTPLALLGLCQIASFMALCRITGLETFTWALVAAFAFFVASPQWLFLMEFGPNNTAMGLGLVAASFSALAFSIAADPKRSWVQVAACVIVSAVCLCATVGLYQAFFVVGLVVSSAAIIFCYVRGTTTFSRVVGLHGLLLTSAATGFVASGIVGRFANWFYSIERVEFYADGFINLPALFSNPASGMALAWSDFLGVVWGAGGFYYLSTWAFGATLLLSSLLFVWAAFKRGPVVGVLGAAWVLLANISIVAFQLAAAGGGQRIPYRVMTVMPMLSAFLFVASISLLGWKARYALMAVALIATFQGSVVFNRAAAGSTLMAQKDAFIAGDLFRRVASVGKPGDFGLYKIEISGRIVSRSPYPMPPTSQMAHSWFDLAPLEFQAPDYMRSLGYPVIGDYFKGDFAEQFAGMPSWPSEGSTRVVGDTVLIKLSD